MTDKGATPAFLACGDLAIDSVVLIDHFPTADEKLWVEPAGDYPGGMMGNAAAAAASVGIHAGVVALVGTDDRGRLVMDALHRRGIDTRFVREVDAPTFWTLSLTMSSGARSLIQFPTPAFGCDWARFDRSALSGVRWVHTVAEEGDPVGPLLRDAREAGAITSLDIEYPFVLESMVNEFLPWVDVAFLNSAAAEALGGPEVAARKIQRSGAGTVLVTLGENGALLLDTNGATASAPVYQVNAVDTNGAGDAFAGAYASGVLKGFEPQMSLELGVFVAGLSTTAFGGFGPELEAEQLRDLARDAGYKWWELL